MATLSMDNSNIIGISYSQMNSVKVSMKRAQQMLEISQRNVNTAKLQVQVDKGRLKVTEDSLWNLYSEASKRKTKIDTICNNIDYTIRRFKEVDSRCAASIRSIGKYYNSQLSMIDRIKNNFIGLKFSITSNLKTLLEEGTSVFNFLKTKASEAYNAVSEFMEAHPWIGNTLGVIGGIGQMGVYALLLTPPFTPIGVLGMAFGFNSAVYSGTKLINNITNGSNEGTNALKSIFSLFGGGGETAYDILDMGFAVATIPIEGGFALSKASQIATESNGAIKGLSALIKGIKEVEKMKVDKLSSIINSTLGKVIEPMSKVKVYFKNSFGEFFNFKSFALPEGFSINISKIDDVSDSSKIVNKIGQVSENSNDMKTINKTVKTVDNLLKETNCSKDELIKYLKSCDDYFKTNYADEFLDMGTWPEDIQIPKSSDVLTSNGTIDWSQVPDSGYILDSNGKAIKEIYFPKKGEIIDRYGPANGTFTSPVIDGLSYSYDKRSLPYLEDLSKYHQYELTDDLSKLADYIKECGDKDLIQDIDDFMAYKRIKSYDDLKSYKGDIASGFGVSGGGIQYQLPLPVDILEDLGLLKMIK